MGKASSNKKVARAAKAGGSRARAAGERNFVFPAALVLVVVLGVSLVVYARDNRQAEALEAPVANADHWHASYAFYTCDTFQDPLPEFHVNSGTHTHGDGLIHIHPFDESRSGDNATLANFVEDAGGSLSDTELQVPGGDTFIEGETECEGVDGDPIVQVLYWESATDALNGEDPEVFTEDLDEIRFNGDGEAYVIAYAPRGADIDPPPSTDGLSSVTDDLGTPTTTTEPIGGSTTTTAPGGSTTTTAPGGSTTTTAPGTTTTTAG